MESGIDEALVLLSRLLPLLPLSLLSPLLGHPLEEFLVVVVVLDDIVEGMIEIIRMSYLSRWSFECNSA